MKLGVNVTRAADGEEGLKMIHDSTPDLVLLDLILPKKSDSAIVGAASKFYFRGLLQAGVRIFMYKKGFVHSKTLVADTNLSVVGTANMDIRSFDLNFEIMAVIYGSSFAKQLENDFLNDLNECDELNHEDWIKQGVFMQLSYSIARLISSFL